MPSCLHLNTTINKVGLACYIFKYNPFCRTINIYGVNVILGVPNIGLLSGMVIQISLLPPVNVPHIHK